MPDLSWCLTIREFQDMPADLSGRISLLQATIWSCSPIALILLESENFQGLQSEVSAQLEDQNLNVWIKKNGPNAMATLEQLLHLYESFQNLQMEVQKKEALIKMGGLQQRMPTPMFDRYRQLQGIKDTHPKDQWH